MAQIIQELKIDALTTTPTILDFLLEELFKLKFSTENLKYISIGAEFCSSARYAYFKKQFPQATFHLRYGNSEQGGGVRNYRCKELEASGNPNIFHVDENICLIEIVDENGNPANEGAVGEIVTTDLQRKAFPLIRYRLKDMGSLSKVACECGNSTLLTINGRTGFDFLKINGLTLHSELIAEAVAQAKELVELRWQLHLHEEIPNDKPKLKFSLQLKLLPKFAVKTSDPFLIEIISEKISAKLQLSKTKTLKNLAEEGIVLPLEILFVNSWPKEAKSKNIISHIN
jgi:phenylacetate-CoA ligase